MKKVWHHSELSELASSVQEQDKTIVVAGGCFDILHPGHITFLTAAKEKGDTLIVFLESDETMRRLKGTNRPLQTQKDRALILSALEAVDLIIMLEPNLSDKKYDELILALKPAIIATTEGDPYLQHKKRQAELSGAKVEEVIRRLTDYSSSSLAERENTL